MTNIDQLQRLATGLVGALLLSTACVTAAVGPARAAETAPAAQASAPVSGQLA